MAKTPPTDKDITLFVAEDIRQELNNKVSLAGFFPSSQIGVKDIGPNIAVPLAFLVVVNGGEGTFKFKMDFFSPAGNPIFQGPEVDFEKLPGKGAQTAAKIMNFPVASAGKYRIDIYFDGKKFSREIEIIHDPTLTL